VTDSHLERLERMYEAAPVNERYEPTLSVRPGAARVEVTIDESMFHAAGGVHGSHIFKLLDDAAFVAATGVEDEHFVLTADFDVHLLAPVSEGQLVAEAEIAQESSSALVAEATVRDDGGTEIARGTGRFVPSEQPLDEVPGYADEA